MSKRVWLIVYRNSVDNDDVQVATCHSKGALVSELDRVKHGYYVGNAGKPTTQIRVFELDPATMALTEVQEPTVTISPVL